MFAGYGLRWTWALALGAIALSEPAAGPHSANTSGSPAPPGVFKGGAQQRAIAPLPPSREEPAAGATFQPPVPKPQSPTPHPQPPLPSPAEPLKAPVRADGPFLRLAVAPNAGAPITEFGLQAVKGNYAGDNGLVQEGFGVASRYIPNRRLNEACEVVEAAGGMKGVRYTYDCDGPNIAGLHVTRIIEPQPGESSLRVQWRVENRGSETHWVAPWVRNPVVPGASFDTTDRIDLPTLDGVQRVERSGYYPASRNWAALTDPVESISVCGIFDANETHAFLAVWEPARKLAGFQTAFVPRLMKPGDSWETTYRLNIVRGMKHVDFATDELAAQVDYRPGMLELFISAVKPMADVHIHASVVAENGRRWKLPVKKFDIDPNRVIRCPYAWTAPGDGMYDLMAQLRPGGTNPLDLGKDTHPPHGGIDTRFNVGKGKAGMEPWTEAPFAVERGPRTIKRTLAFPGDTAVWVASPLEKIFREDVPESNGAFDPMIRVALARNERESFQIVVRPPKDRGLHGVTFRTGRLIHRDAGQSLGENVFRVMNVGYVPIRVPSHYEGPTGEWPDPLIPFEPFTAPAGRCSPVWFTLYAPPNAAAGVYTGSIVMTGIENGETVFPVEATVYDFDLPVTPSLKTDFGFRPDLAREAAERMGCTLAPGDLAARYVANALDHRVTLREAAQFPPASPDYTSDLARFEPRFKDLIVRGGTTFSVPARLLEAPTALGRANAFVAGRNINDRAFCAIASEPPPDEWPQVAERAKQWQTIAPAIPAMITAFGLDAYLPDFVPIWCAHLQLFDTPNGRPLLERIGQGRETWFYVNHQPPRPYANLFMDFAGIEHRILPWQAWALGVRGMHHWCVNHVEKGQDPYANPADVTPVNGDGLLLYPGKDGPVDSIRWELLRDGIEDYDYLTILADCLRKARQKGAPAPLIAQAESALNLKTIVPNLTSFTRDTGLLESKRAEMARAIVALGKYR